MPLFWTVTALAQDLPPAPHATLPQLEVFAEDLTSVSLPADACVDPEGGDLDYEIRGPEWAVLTGLELTLKAPQTAHGWVGLDLYADDGNQQALCGTVGVRVTDDLPPVVTLTAPLSIDRLTRFAVTVVVSEVVELEAGHFEMAGGEVLSLNRHPEGTVLAVRADGSGPMVVSVPDGVIQDPVGNVNAGTSVGIAFVAAPPESPPYEDPEAACQTGSRWDLTRLRRR